MIWKRSNGKIGGNVIEQKSAFFETNKNLIAKDIFCSGIR